MEDTFSGSSAKSCIESEDHPLITKIRNLHIEVRPENISYTLTEVWKMIEVVLAEHAQRTLELQALREERERLEKKVIDFHLNHASPKLERRCSCKRYQTSQRRLIPSSVEDPVVPQNHPLTLCPQMNLTRTTGGRSWATASNTSACSSYLSGLSSEDELGNKTSRSCTNISRSISERATPDSMRGPQVWSFHPPARPRFAGGVSSNISVGQPLYATLPRIPRTNGIVSSEEMKGFKGKTENDHLPSPPPFRSKFKNWVRSSFKRKSVNVTFRSEL